MEVEDLGSDPRSGSDELHGVSHLAGLECPRL